MRVLVVVTSHSVLGSRGTPTGYYLPEVTHPYAALANRGIEVDIASPKGGEAPLDRNSVKLDDPITRQLWETPEFRRALQNTLKLDEVDASQYSGVVFAGGHGTMWDFRTDPGVQRVTREVWENNGVVGAVCHGPAALVDVKLSNGKYLVDGKTVSAFTDEEEEAAGLTKIVPFLLASELKTRGAKHTFAPLWRSHVVADGRLVTGQNPASAKGVCEKVAEILANRSE